MLRGHDELGEFDQFWEQGVSESHGFKKLALEGVEDLIGGSGGVASWLERLETMTEKALAVDVGESLIDEVIRFIDLLQAAFRAIEVLFDLNKNMNLRHIVIIVDFAASTMKGLLKDHVFTKGFDSIHDIGFTDWLKRSGATIFTTLEKYLSSKGGSSSTSMR